MPKRSNKDSEAFELLTTDQVADLLHLGVSTIRGWRQQGLGPPWRRVGRRILYRRTDLERWFELQPGS